METTVYLIRHSVRLNMKNNIESYNTTQGSLIKSEKIILSVTGEIRAEKLSNEKELQNIDVVYASNCVRTLQTAKYLMEKQNLKANLDERLDERRTGKPNDKEYPDWYTRQFKNENFKTEGGESQKDVRERMEEAFNEIVEKNKGKRITIFTLFSSSNVNLNTSGEFSFLLNIVFPLKLISNLCLLLTLFNLHHFNNKNVIAYPCENIAILFPLFASITSCNASYILFLTSAWLSPPIVL